MRTLKITNSITRRDEKSLEKYLAEIAKYEVLMPEEELTLFKEFKSGSEEALLRIIHHNLRFVVSVAKQYQYMGMWLGDLINEGNIGLLKAAQRFDETKGFKFISYAVWWIRQSILQAVSENSRKIRVPLNFIDKALKVKGIKLEMLQKKEREPSVEELVEVTGYPEETVRRCLQFSKKCSSLHAPIQTDGDQMLLDVLPDNDMSEPDYEMAVCESQKTEVTELLKMLTERESFVLSMYYGIGQQRSFDLSDIAEYLGVSRERVRQLRDRGLMKLRQKTKGFTPTFYPN